MCIGQIRGDGYIRKRRLLKDVIYNNCNEYDSSSCRYDTESDVSYELDLDTDKVLILN